MKTLLESKPFVISTTIIIIAFLGLAYISLQDTIDRAAPVLFWGVIGIIGVAILMVFIVQIEKLFTLRTQMKAARAEAEAVAKKAQAEALNANVIRAQKGEQVFVKLNPKDQYHALHLNPKWYSNGHHEQPSIEEVQAFVTYHNGVIESPQEQLVIDQQSVTSEDVSLTVTDILSNYNQDWIQTLLSAPHVHYCGATRIVTGKQ